MWRIDEVRQILHSPGGFAQDDKGCGFAQDDKGGISKTVTILCEIVTPFCIIYCYICEMDFMNTYRMLSRRDFIKISAMTGGALLPALPMGRGDQDAPIPKAKHL